MTQDIEFVEAAEYPHCPHCDRPLARIEYIKQKLSFGLMGGFEWIILLSCPDCRKVIGTSNR